MGRTNPSVPSLQTGKVYFRPKHIKSKDNLFTKYKKHKKCKKFSKSIKIGLKPTILTKSAIDNSNQCLQSNRYLIFIHNGKIIRIDLDTMKTNHIDFQTSPYSRTGIEMCAMPDQKYFCIDFSNKLIFTINKSLKISENKAKKPRMGGSIIYLDGLIYLLGAWNGANHEMEIYDLIKEKWKKAASFSSQKLSWYKIFATFEGKILIGPYNQGILNAYDPVCNSFSNLLEFEMYGRVNLLVANDKLYCIQSGGFVFESLPRDCMQWVCIGNNSIITAMYGLPWNSLYKDSIYFIGTCAEDAYLFEFNLKARNIKYVDYIF